jgi:hypothetical protein
MNRETVIRFLLALLGVFWLFVVTLSYYIVHKPFGLDNALAILNASGDVLVAAAIFALAASLGRRLLRPLTFVSSLEALIFQAGIGLGIISFSVFALGLLGLINRILFWTLLLLLAFILRSDLAMLWRDLRALRLPVDSRFGRALAIFVGFSLALAFLFALMPPTAWDGQVHHLVQARLYIEGGRITAPPDVVYFSFPSLVEMLFLAAMVLKGDIVTQLIHFGFLLLTLGAVFAFSLRYFSARVAWLATALLVAVPSLLLISTWAYVDLALVFYTFAALFALLVGLDSAGDWRWFALSGSMAGLALGVKYTSAIVPLGLGVLLLMRRNFDIRHWLATFGFCALFAAPWYLRNLFFMGNPAYPFLWGGPYWDSFRANWFGRFGTGLLNTPLHLLTAPWDATVSGVEGKVGYQATLGPLLLILLPLIIFIMRTRDEGRKVAFSLIAFSAILYAFWSAGVAESELLLQTRLLFPAFPAFALVAAYAFDRLDVLDIPQFSFKRFTSFVILIALASTALGYALDFAGDNPLGYLAGTESRESWLARHLGGYFDATVFMNTKLPADAKILFLWEPRFYYVNRSVQPDSTVDNSPHLQSLYSTTASLADALRRAGYTYILVNRAGLENLLETHGHPVSLAELVTLNELTAGYVRQVYPDKPLEPVTLGDVPVLKDAETSPYGVYELLGATR